MKCRRYYRPGLTTAQVDYRSEHPIEFVVAAYRRAARQEDWGTERPTTAQVPLCLTKSVAGEHTLQLAVGPVAQWHHLPAGTSVYYVYLVADPVDAATCDVPHALVGTA
ncbi:hypothetical protein ACIB24_07350 [Spongisporangium articulatum]|uniref:Uncharacterized protein n=1 Tax=Spongisporangium articulatum TaxID=3362603 RepID=A0ABW8AKJ4_9ACTN